ncbi:unnamed protein product [Chrysodeixis includens]|uniref:Uncharacterized protein n=1 Tax=Chrysodeixis includens TaxID=689277 RepID=A0A9P0BZK3_CHRIL|nr:unnamed protein product [Chrysodeixis includens]
MSNNNVNNDKKKSLLAYKEKILQEIKYYETRIEDFRANHKNNSYRDDDDSSDSGEELLQMIDMGPSIAQLKLKQEVMKTCLLATQELTSLTVLESQVNVLVDAPDINREKPITEPGLWIEVTAECEIDLVNFTIHFYMHKPYRTFAPPSYRCLRVEPVRESDKLELDKSVLHTLKLPSDAVEVMKSYNAAFRSRRTTLSKLDKKFANALLMEKHPEGGYMFKCAGLLEVCWRLENKWSPVAPFHHRMKFDLEYMDEAYIKIITQAHKQLLDPSLQTDERTLLLAKIITTCIEARGPIDTESDLESKTEKDEFERRDSEVMAPPKSLPKKSKNTKKRILDEVDENTVKRMKSNDFESINNKKTNIVDEFTSVVKKMKGSDGVASAKNVQESDVDDVSSKDGNTGDNDEIKNKNVKKTNVEVKNANSKIQKKVAKDSTNIDEAGNTKPKNTQKESVNRDYDENEPTKTDVVEKNVKNSNTKPKKITKDSGNTAVKNTVNKAKNKINEVSEDKTGNTKPKTKSSKDTGNTDAQTTNKKSKNIVNDNVEEINKNSDAKKKRPNDDDNTKENNTNKKPKNMENDNIDLNKDNNNAKKKISKDTGKSAAKNIKNKTENVENIQNDQNNDNKAIKKKIAKDSGNIVSKNKPDIIEDGNTEEKTSKSIPKNKIVKNIETNQNNVNLKTKSKITREPSNLEQGVKSKNTQKDTGKTEVTTKPKNTDKKENNVASAKNDENIATKDVDRQSKVINKNTNVVTAKKSKPDLNNDVNTKKSIANDKQDIVKKNPQVNTKKLDLNNAVNPVNKKQSIANTKNDVAKKGTEINIKNKENTDLFNKDGNVIKNTQKNATNRIKDKISTITEKVSEKNIHNKPTDNIKSNTNTNVIKKTSIEPKIKNIVPKISSHRTSIKLPNNKVLKASNTGVKTGNINKDGGKPKSKIPQKKLSPISESSSKKNPLRISPRKMLPKFKNTVNLMKQKVLKTTSIPRLMKDSVLKRT